MSLELVTLFLQLCALLWWLALMWVSLAFVAQVVPGALRHSAVGPARVPSAAARRSVVVLVPAHNESAGIAATVASIRAQLLADDRVLVVADNCSDDTAEVARHAGAEVLVRQSQTQRGKGYALDHGIRHLEAQGPQPAVLVMVDADTLLEPMALDALVRTCVATGRPVQSCYLMKAPLGAGVGTLVAEFAWRIKNRIRPLGGQVLGWPCQLMGSGMAFPWPLIASAPVASGHLVEDMQLGVSLAQAGSPPVYCAQAVVVSRFPSTAQGLSTQRERWEHGHLQMIAHAGLRLMGVALWRRSWALLGMALDLCIPPLTSLLMLALITALGGVLMGGWMQQWDLTLLAMAPLVTLGLAGTLAWSRAGRDLLPPSALNHLARYALAKLPVYAKFFSGRQSSWIRTRRDDESP
jgi:cellulose synthase/poly-beta-1,6-N-acetylglucosamine synthase-like glycosyltransferase